MSTYDLEHFLEDATTTKEHYSRLTSYWTLYYNDCIFQIAISLAMFRTWGLRVEKDGADTLKVFPKKQPK